MGATVAVLVYLMTITPTALVPNEDTGILFCMVNLPPGSSQERTGEVLEQTDKSYDRIPP